ncbi:hypothetical protein LIT32_12320 [Bacillus sp. CMF21]|nr:hypothetical protein LIT32_12320 [Bacillus sp. CMF21]
MKSFILGVLMLLLLSACSDNKNDFEYNEREEFVGEKIFHELNKHDINVAAEGITEEEMIIALMIRTEEGENFKSIKQTATDAINKALKENDIKGYKIEIEEEPEW